MGKELPKNWVLPKLRQIVKYQKGKKPKILNEEEFDGSVPYLDIKAFEKDEVRRYADIKSSTLIQKDEIGIVWDGARSGWVSKNKAGAVGSTIAILKPVGVNPELLYRFLESKFDYLNTNTRGIGIPHVDPNVLWDIDFPLPPLLEQTRIVAKLDQLFGQLEQIKESLDKIPQLLKDFRQQVLTQAVTGKLTAEWREGKELLKWKEKTLGSILLETPKNGAYYPKSFYGRGTRIIRIDSFYDGILKYWEKVQKVEISDKDYEVYKLEEGNIVINRVNSIDYLGKCMLVEDLPEPAIFESNMMRLKLDRDIILPKYLRIYLISQIGLKQLRQNAKHAVNQASINQTDVKMVIINLPKLEEQQEIVTRVETLFDKADLIEQQYQTLKQKIDTLPQAILHKAFKGELVPQLDSDGDARELLEQIKALKKQSAKPNDRVSPSASSGQAKVEVLKKSKAYMVEDVKLGRVAEEDEKYK